MITGNETAYPVVEIEEGVGVAASDERGLTIRQHFAAMAMQAIISKHGIIANNQRTVAISAVVYADALINELNKAQ